MMLRFLVVVASLLAIEAFTAPKAATKSWALSMAPKYDKVVGKWSVTNPATEGPEAGYGIGKTLLLRGPKPFFHRLFQPDDYEQAVLKFMAGEKCSRIEAQGNMDAYLENAQDWAYSRFESQRTGRKPNYTDIDQEQLIKTLVWSAMVFAGIGRLLYVTILNATGEGFWDFLK